MDMVRSFISIPIPQMQKMDSLKNELRGYSGLNVSKESHITLQFLGDVEITKLKTLSEKMAMIRNHDKFTIRLKGVGAFPDMKRPRVIWVGVEPADLMRDLTNEFRNILDGLKIEYDKKPFKAHVTVARVRDASSKLNEFFDLNENKEIGSFECKEIFLMKSVLTPKGAVHSEVSSIRLYN